MTQKKTEEVENAEMEADMLTPSEIAQLRQEMNEADAYFQKAFEDISPTNP